MIPKKTYNNICVCGHNKKYHALENHHVLGSSHCTYAITSYLFCKCRGFTQVRINTRKPIKGKL